MAPRAPPAVAPAPAPAPAEPRPVTKAFGFSILEDYDKGADLADVARDFALFHELGVTTWRGSFGWDDYEPRRGRYDFAWLHRFVALAAREGITLRPYLGYTPEWAARGRRADGQTWNDPPRRLAEWTAFVRAIATAMRRHPNVLSWEIYNEENTKLWWDGTAAEYATVLAAAARVLHAVDSTRPVLLGGMVWPDVDWVEAACATDDVPRLVAVVPVHGYAETWPDSLAVEDQLGASYRDDFLPTVRAACGPKPIWINEAGYATTPGRTERQQAEWWVRALATWAADSAVTHVGIYEIKDQPRHTAVIGDTPNYYLGLTYPDRRKKLAFHTVQRLVALLADSSLTVDEGGVAVAVTGGRPGRLFHHYFRRSDGRRVLVVWDKSGDPVLRLALREPAGSATEFGLDGRGTPVALAEDGRVLAGVRLAPGAVRLFELRP
ncbi:MAG TPA: beta-galactosidase [Gemmatimonadales bacterium]|nr:beta-galactosidase [Gemmatimonadales bacterium]